MAIVSAGPAARTRAALLSARRIVRPEPFVLVAMACAFVAGPWLRGQVIGQDGIGEFYTRLFFITRELKAGELPAWYPHVLSGMPLLADISTGLFHPLTMPLAWLLSPTNAINTWVLVHVAVSGLSMYLYLGSASLSLSRPSRFLGAAIYMLACPPAARIFSGDWQRLALYALIPLPFYFAEEIIQGRQRMGAAVLGALALACQFLAGDPQTLVYASAVLAAYVVARMWQTSRGTSAGPRSRAVAVPLLSMACLAAGLGAIQALPTLQLFLLSNRRGFDPDFSLVGSMPPVGLLTLLAPHLFGDEVHGSWGEGELRAPDFYVHSAILYTGFFTLALAIVALLARRDRPHVRFFAVTGLLVLWIALGRYGYLYRAAVYLPVLRSFRDIENVNLLVPLCASVLAAFGLDRLLERDRAARVCDRTALALAAVVAGAALLLAASIVDIYRTRGFILFLHPFPGRQIGDSAVFVLAALGISVLLLVLRVRAGTAPAWLAGAVTALVIVDLLAASLPFVTAGSDLRAWERSDWVTEYLARDRSLYRVDGFAVRAPLFGLQDAGGQMGLLSDRYSEYTNFLQGYPLDAYVRPGSVHGVLLSRLPPATLPLLDLLNVKYVLRARGADLPWRLDASAGGADAVVVTNPGALPRVMDAYGYEILHDRLAMLLELIRPGRDPRRVILEEPPAAPPGTLQSDAASAAGPPAGLHVLSYGATRVVIAARFARPGFLVLHDLYYPAWTATVDGRPAKIYRANYLFRAVVVPAGEHEVRFVYRDRLFELGAEASGLTLIVGLLAWLADRRRRAASAAA